MYRGSIGCSDTQQTDQQSLKISVHTRMYIVTYLWHIKHKERLCNSIIQFTFSSIKKTQVIVLFRPVFCPLSHWGSSVAMGIRQYKGRQSVSMSPDGQENSNSTSYDNIYTQTLFMCAYFVLVGTHFLIQIYNYLVSLQITSLFLMYHRFWALLPLPREIFSREWERTSKNPA